MPEISDQIVNEVRRQLANVDLVIFSDFNYGVLPQEVVEELCVLLQQTDAILCADSQSSSQFGDIARFIGMDLLTPTEREARLSVRNIGDGLNVLGESLRSAANARQVILTLGQEGALVCPSGDVNQSWSPDQIEALNTDPKDVAGAGDSLLTVSGMALAVGATIWEAACLGSIAAAIQVGRLGNTAISMEEMLSSLKT
ncbi:PfkB family carbohydrate kinase [Luminiphilus sp.]|nr:PfkB family carbohydrate kinase [Luminiphilus sp.]